MEAYWLSGSRVPRILGLGTSVGGQLHASATLLPGNNPSYPLDRRLGGPWSRSGWGGEEKNPQPLPGLEAPIIQSVAQRYTTELSEGS
jgi:hypothetical protein